MSFWIALPVVLPLLAAAVAQVFHRRLAVQRAIGVGVLGVLLADSVYLLAEVWDGSVLVAEMGGWEAPVGIVLVVDPLSAIMLCVSALMTLSVLVYAIGDPRASDDAPFFHPVYLVMAAGISMSFLTGDLFNLFVAFEVTLMASYVLLTLGGRSLQVRHGMSYVVINLLASTLFVTAVGLTYAATGTVNMADLVGKLAEIEPATRTALGLLFVVVFGIKAAIFPLFFWLPDSYPTAPSPITAVFAGLLTKVGVYAIIRSQTVLFPSDGPSGLLLFLAGATMLVGVLGAIAQNDIKRILSFHIISQIGYMIFGLALFTLAGIAGAVFYIVHHIIVKTTLFLVGGLIEQSTGTGALRRLGGLSHASPLLAGLFLLPALSLAGIPPLSGFVAKLSLVQAGLEVGAALTVTVSLVVSILTLFSMTKIWAGAFWGTPDEVPPVEDALEGRLRLPAMMVAATATLVVASVAYVVAAGPLFDLGIRAAEVLTETDAYVTAVLG